MKRLLVLFANSFPYNISEPFLENEYPLYREYYDKVLLVTACTRHEQPTRRLDDPCIELLCDYTLSRDLRSILEASACTLTDPMLYRELGQLAAQDGLTARRLYDMLAVALCGNHRALQVRRWLRQHPQYRIEALYSYWLHIPAYAALRLDALLREKHYTVSRTHGYDLYAERHATGYIPFHRQLYHGVSAVAAICEHGKAYLESRYGDDGKVAVHRLGAADLGCHNPAGARSPFRIVSCARTVPLKRLHRIVDALRLIPDVPIHWTHIGAGPAQKALEQYAKDRLLQNVTAVFTGAIPNTAVYEHYRRQPVHAFINVSETEGAPVAIMEAMSFGIPVIATAVGGTAELVDAGISGYLLPGDFSDDELAACILRMRRLSRDSYAKMRQAARAKFEREYSAIPNYRHFLECLVSRRVSP